LPQANSYLFALAEQTKWVVGLMRSATLMTVAASLLIAGCAGNSINAIECAAGTTTKNCAEGTLGRQQMVQEQEADDTTGAIDDAKCRSFAAPDSQAYFDCRRRATSSRKSSQPR
jgi:hypothetical protein